MIVSRDRNSSKLKVQFFHDHEFPLSSDNKIYSTGCFPAEVWGRYLKHFDSLTVTGRKSKRSPLLGESLSSRDSVQFKLVDSASNIRTLLRLDNSVRKEIRELVRSQDAIIARLSSEVGLIAITEARKAGIPYAVEVVDCPWDSLVGYGSWAARLYAPLLYLRTRRAVSRAPFALYVTESFLQRRYPAPRARQVSCSNVEIDDQPEAILAQRVERLSGDHPPILGQIASLTGQFKGIQFVIRALPRLRYRFPGITYRVLGAGDKERWEKFAKEYGVDDICFFDGTLPSGSQVFKWLDSIDLYVHPSLKEGLPRAVIEAMSRGCPVVASDVAGTPELIPADKLVKKNNQQDLEERIEELLDDSQKQYESARANFFKAKEYSKELLDRKRDEFWESFMHYAKENMERDEKIE